MYIILIFTYLYIYIYIIFIVINIYDIFEPFFAFQRWGKQNMTGEGKNITIASSTDVTTAWRQKLSNRTTVVHQRKGLYDARAKTT